MNIERRIQRAEKLIGIEEEERPTLNLCLPDGDDTVPHFPEPVTDWVTLQRAKNEARRQHVPCLFIADPHAEYEARQENGRAMR
jgi:hypothetical protein